VITPLLILDRRRARNCICEIYADERTCRCVRGILYSAVCPASKSLTI